MENTSSFAAVADIANWTEAVEGLVHDGQVEGTDSKLGQLSAALLDLSKLYATQGFSIKADEARSRAFLLKQVSPFSLQMKNADDANKSSKESRGNLESSSNLQGDGSKQRGSSVDDWEAIADRDPNELLSPSGLPEVSNLSLQGIQKFKHPKDVEEVLSYIRNMDCIVMNSLKGVNLNTRMMMFLIVQKGARIL